MRTLLPGLALCGACTLLTLSYPAAAQILPGVTNPCCATCGLVQCSCTTLEPVVRTRLRPRQVVQWQNVTRTGWKTETHCETVPVTTWQNVTRDEGGYQMVWVPKPVTRAVPRTVLQQRVGTHQVPVSYQTAVPRTVTQLVPERHIQYVPRTHHYTVPVAPACPTCVPGVPAIPGGPAPYHSHQHTPPGAGYAAPPSSGYPVMPAPAHPAPLTLPPGPANSGPTVPEPVDPADSSARNSDGHWTEISRPGSGSVPATSTGLTRQQNYDGVSNSPSSSQPGDTTDRTPNPAARGKFVRAPSAATVWQTRPAVRRNFGRNGR